MFHVKQFGTIDGQGIIPSQGVAIVIWAKSFVRFEMRLLAARVLLAGFAGLANDDPKGPDRILHQSQALYQSTTNSILLPKGHSAHNGSAPWEIWKAGIIPKLIRLIRRFNLAAIRRNSIVGKAEHVTEFMRRTCKV
jgi:hypothetical protein